MDAKHTAHTHRGGTPQCSLAPQPLPHIAKRHLAFALLCGLAAIFSSCHNNNIGDAVKQDGVRCFVATVDDQGQPTLWMTTEEIVGVTADSAARWAAALGTPGEWTLPTKEQMLQLTADREVFNETASRKGLPAVFARTSFYWTGTATDDTHIWAWGPYGLRSYFAADAHYRARAVKSNTAETAENISNE